MSVQTVLRKNILNYISNSPLAWEYPPAYFEDMMEKDLLRLVDGTIDNRESRAEEHSYEIIEVDSFLSVQQYEHYAPTWCIFQSEEIFFEETHQGSCHFVFASVTMQTTTTESPLAQIIHSTTTACRSWQYF